MPRLSIPSEQTKTIDELLKLHQKHFDALLDALADAPLSVDLSDWERDAAARLSPILPNAARFIHAIIALNVTRSHADSDISDFADDVIDAVNASDATKRNGVARTKERLLRLLGIQSLIVSSKAIHLKIDRERLFGHARILTDARPVFGPKVTDPPVATLITHTLKLAYYQDDESKDFYLALDEDDITELEEVLSRAKTKAATLTKQLQLSKMMIVKG